MLPLSNYPLDIQMQTNDQKDRSGVYAVAGIVNDQLNCIFREQPTSDYGIDAQIELVNNGNPTGKLIGLQIKSGAGNFRETKGSFYYYGEPRHLQYWLHHSLPVLIIAHIPKRITVWNQVKKSKVTITEKGWSMKIPKSNVFDASALHKIKKILSTHLKINDLFLHIETMKHIKSGGKIVIHKDEWSNKSFKRGSTQLIKVDLDGTETILLDDNIWYTGYTIEDMIAKIYPWANIEIDEEFYQQNYSTDLDGIKLRHILSGRTIYPYACDNEISSYRLQLRINPLGLAAIKVADYIDSIE